MGKAKICFAIPLMVNICQPLNYKNVEYYSAWPASTRSFFQDLPGIFGRLKWPVLFKEEGMAVDSPAIQLSFLNFFYIMERVQ